MSRTQRCEGEDEASRNGLGGDMESHAKRPALYANGDRMMTPAMTGKSHAGGLFGFMKTSQRLPASMRCIHHRSGAVDHVSEL